MKTIERNVQLIHREGTLVKFLSVYDILIYVLSIANLMVALTHFPVTNCRSWLLICCCLWSFGPNSSCLSWGQGKKICL